MWQREDYLKCPPRGNGDTGEGRRKGEGESLFRYFPGPIQVLFLTLLPFSKVTQLQYFSRKGIFV